MQFTIVAALFAVAVVAAPAPAQVEDRSFLSSIGSDISSITNATVGNGCDVAKCLVALAPAGVGCAAAAVQAGIDPIADAACIAAAVNDGINFPAACTGCASSVGL